MQRCFIRCTHNRLFFTQKMSLSSSEEFFFLAYLTQLKSQRNSSFIDVIRELNELTTWPLKRTIFAPTSCNCIYFITFLYQSDLYASTQFSIFLYSRPIVFQASNHKIDPGIRRNFFKNKEKVGAFQILIAWIIWSPGRHFSNKLFATTLYKGVTQNYSKEFAI